MLWKLQYSVRDPSIPHQGLRIKDDTFGLPSVSTFQNHGFIEICYANLKTNLIESKFIKPLFIQAVISPTVGALMDYISAIEVTYSFSKWAKVVLFSSEELNVHNSTESQYTET